MCARYSLTKEGLVITIGEIEIVIHVGARYNIAPRQKVPVIVAAGTGFSEVEMIWGWQPVWSKQFLINAKAETLTEESTFKKYLHQRCLIPADGFYEWTVGADLKLPIRFTMPGDVGFCFAGFWYAVERQAGDLETADHHFVIITTAPNPTVAKINDRMPLIVQPKHYDWWLRQGQRFESVLKFPDQTELNFCPVQPELNKVGTEGPGLIRPYFSLQTVL
jgi:putative SOS response-associated peptidase YedK